MTVHIDGQRVRINLNIYVDPGSWDRRGQRIGPNTKEDPKLAALKNSLIQKWKLRAEKIFLLAQMEDRDINPQIFEDLLIDSDRGGDFLRFFETEIEKEKQVRAQGTVKNYIKTLKALHNFRPRGIAYSAINGETVRAFDRYLHNKKYAPNTVADYHKIFKKFIGMAISGGRLKENPYRHFKIRKAKTSPAFLQAFELDGLVKLYSAQDLTPGRQSILRQFLFSCFTGLRFQDVGPLTQRNIYGNFLQFQPKKTARTRMALRIPLNEIARGLIGDALQDPHRPAHQATIFRARSLQVTNRTLKEIASAGGITQDITTHMGRHTFATNYLAAGGSIEVLQQILGHSTAEMTAVYAHVTDSRKRADMRQLAELFAPAPPRSPEDLEYPAVSLKGSHQGDPNGPKKE